MISRSFVIYIRRVSLIKMEGHLLSYNSMDSRPPYGRSMAPCYLLWSPPRGTEGSTCRPFLDGDYPFSIASSLYMHHQRSVGIADACTIPVWTATSSIRGDGGMFGRCRALDSRLAKHVNDLSETLIKKYSYAFYSKAAISVVQFYLPRWPLRPSVLCDIAHDTRSLDVVRSIITPRAYPLVHPTFQMICQ